MNEQAARVRGDRRARSDGARVSIYDHNVVEHFEASATPSLDSWIAEACEPAVMATVSDLKDAIAEGTAPVLRDAATLQAYWDSRRRQTK
jgi:hypothetical protein